MNYHIFEKCGEYFMFDTSSCRFYNIDELTYCFLKFCHEMSIEDSETQLADERPESKIKIHEIANEIRLLAENGLFDVPDYSMTEDKISQDLDLAYQTPVVGLELALAESCNLACKYCYCGTSRNMPNNGLMSEKIAHQAVLWLFDAAEKTRRKSVNITFFGGEPVMLGHK